MSERNRTSGQPRPIARVIDKLMASLGLSRRYHGWSIVAQWPHIVGEHIARRAHAVSFEDGVLTIAVPSDTWRQELQLQSEVILKEIHAAHGGYTVKRLHLVRGEKG